MDINTKINIISGIMIPLFSMFGAIIGFFVGIYKERNNTKWKEDREAMQCAYACCEELKRSINKNIPINIDLVRDLKNKWFNIKDKKIRNKIFNIVEFGIVDQNTNAYIESKVLEFNQCIDDVLPILLNKLK